MAALVLAALPAGTAAQDQGREGEGSPAGTPHPGEALRVYVITLGMGDFVWEQFGHNLLRIEDTSSGTDISWEWGVFDFDQPGFYRRLMKGTMLYSMGQVDTEAAVEFYRERDRDVWMQELDMTPEQKWALLGSVLDNWRPENQRYRYDYYRDNCSTRLRDILDRALGGAIEGSVARDTTEHSYRWHTRRLLRGVPLAYAGIQLVLGNRADEPITAWEEMFLPLRLREHLSSVSVRDEAGEEVPLVKHEEEVHRSRRPPTPSGPPFALPWFLLLGLVWGGLVVALASVGARGVVARVALVAAAGAWSLLAGVGGVVLLLAWALTDHVFWGWNENVAQVDPLSLLVGLGIMVLLVRPSVPAWTVRLARWVALVSVAGFVLQPLPGLDQVNGEVLAATLPLNLAVAWALGRWKRGAGGPATGGTAPGFDGGSGPPA